MSINERPIYSPGRVSAVSTSSNHDYYKKMFMQQELEDITQRGKRLREKKRREEINTPLVPNNTQLWNKLTLIEEKLDNLTKFLAERPMYEKVQPETTCVVRDNLVEFADFLEYAPHTVGNIARKSDTTAQFLAILNLAFEYIQQDPHLPVKDALHASCRKHFIIL
jgi:hypothetical protein